MVKFGKEVERQEKQLFKKNKENKDKSLFVFDAYTIHLS
jgi:hypothetical protein